MTTPIERQAHGPLDDDEAVALLDACREALGFDSWPQLNCSRDDTFDLRYCVNACFFGHRTTECLEWVTDTCENMGCSPDHPCTSCLDTMDRVKVLMRLVGILAPHGYDQVERLKRYLKRTNTWNPDIQNRLC